MPVRKGSATSGKSGKSGVSAPSNKYAQEQMESGNPKPTADAPSKRKSSRKAATKGRK